MFVIYIRLPFRIVFLIRTISERFKNIVFHGNGCQMCAMIWRIVPVNQPVSTRSHASLDERFREVINREALTIHAYILYL